jgi:pimeloyl-ACP methyl ester carboxylesterase
MTRLFVPGWGAPSGLYAVPAGWEVLDPPRFGAGATIEARLGWLSARIDRCEGPVTLGGHSMGAALAVLAARERPERVRRLVLVAPAGLPLTKPIAASLRDFFEQLASRVYPTRLALHAIAAVARAPRSALRLACAVRALDLERQLGALRAIGIQTDVVGCTTDSLTTARHCRRIAQLAGARYRELDLPGGHMWMLWEPAAFAALLA